MASYTENSFTISLQDYALNKGKTPADFDLETIVTHGRGQDEARDRFNKKAEVYEAVVGMQGWCLGVEGICTTDYFIRGTGVKVRKTEQK